MHKTLLTLKPNLKKIKKNEESQALKQGVKEGHKSVPVSLGDDRIMVLVVARPVPREFTV